jgi:hypothetical protein
MRGSRTAVLGQALCKFLFADHSGGDAIFVNTSAFMRTQLISCRLSKADSALLG